MENYKKQSPESNNGSTLGDLFKEVKATVTGIQEYRKYWEKRRFLKDEGASKNWDGFVCSVLVKVPKSQLKKAFARTEDMLIKQSSNSAKDQVSKIMEKAAKEHFEKAKKHIQEHKAKVELDMKKEAESNKKAMEKKAQEESKAKIKAAQVESEKLKKTFVPF